MQTRNRFAEALSLLKRHPVVALKGVSDRLGISYRALMNWAEGMNAPGGDTLDVANRLVAAVAEQDEDAAREVARVLFGLRERGWVLSRGFAAVSPQVLVTEAIQAGVAVGEVQAAVVAAQSDGAVSAAERARICREADEAIVEIAEVRAAAMVDG
jgi:hypothetical protein